MTEPRLPPLRLHSPNTKQNDTPRSNSSSNLTANLSARERRRARERQFNTSATRRPSDQTEVTPRKARSASVTKPDIPSNNPTDNETETDVRTPKQRPRRVTRKSISEQNQQYDNKAYVDDETVDGNEALQEKQLPKRRRSRKDNKKPPVKKRSAKGKKAKSQGSNPVILNGLEDDVVPIDDDDEYDSKDNNKETDKDFSSDRSQKPLVSLIDALPTVKSTPTDKYFLELEKKFQIQQKNIYEKREETKRYNQYQLEMKNKQREELKYQILTPRTALKCHRLVRLVLLFVHGLNCGFQFWTTVAVNLVYTQNNTSDFTNSKIFDIFRNLILPVHCLSYLFIALCIVDIMDRVDFTKMNSKYLVKCVSFGNSFWSIVLYFIALIVTLSVINIDDDAFMLANLAPYELTVAKSQNVSTWQSLCIVKTAMCSLAWLVLCIFSDYDMTNESLEKRDYTLLDDLIPNADNKNNQQLSSLP